MLILRQTVRHRFGERLVTCGGTDSLERREWEKKCMSDVFSGAFLAGLPRKCDQECEFRIVGRIPAEKCGVNARANAAGHDSGRQIGFSS